MFIRFLLVAMLSLSCVIVNAQEQLDVLDAKTDTVAQDSTTILMQYMRRLQALVAQRDSIDSVMVYGVPNAYYYKMLTRPTLYNSPLHQMMSYSDSLNGDSQLQKLYNMNQMLARLYTTNPSLVLQTEDDISKSGTFRRDVTERLETKDKLSEKVSTSNIVLQMDDKVEVVTRRPNFWKFSGNAALQFTQNHFSENWYQGGENNYAGNNNINLKLVFNNQKKIQWDNLLEFQLGFQTTDMDENRSFRPTSNRLCFTTNFGYKAFKTFYYSMQVRGLTQIVPNYKANTDEVTSDFVSPLDITIAPGIKYEIAYGKKKRFTGTLNVAPLAYSLRYVERYALRRGNGVEEGHSCKDNFGPNVTLNTTWKICNQVSWISNIYWFSNLSYCRMEWQNTINFSVTKLISAQLYLFPRFDDSKRWKSSKDKEDDGRYWMFKEYLSLGINYQF